MRVRGMRSACASRGTPALFLDGEGHRDDLGYYSGCVYGMLGGDCGGVCRAPALSPAGKGDGRAGTETWSARTPNKEGESHAMP